MVFDTAILIAAIAAVPLLMGVAAALMGWGYRRALSRSMLRTGSPDREADPPREPAAGRMGPQLCLIRHSAAGAECGTAADRVLNEALAVSSRVRLAHVIAALVYAVTSVAFVIHSTGKHPSDAMFGMAFTVVVPQFVVLTWSIRLPLRPRLSVLVAVALVGSLVILLLAGPKRGWLLIYALGQLFAVFPLAGLYFLFARRIQPFLVLLAAAVFYVAAGSIVLALMAPDFGAQVRNLTAAKPWLAAVGVANVVVGVILAGLLVRRRWAGGGFVAAVAILALTGRVMLGDDIPMIIGIMFAISGSVFQALFVWMIFKAFVSLQQRQQLLTPEDLQTHCCWAFLTLYLLSLTVSPDLYDDRATLRWGLLLALVLYVTVLHTLLFLIRARRPAVSSRRLLLLRVFGRADESEDLLDVLSNTWRRIGAIDLIAGSDVASRTLRSSMLEAFLLRRTDDQFLKTSADVDKRLDHRRDAIEEDSRYPVNAVYCYGNVWQQAFARLAQSATAVVMDVRGFTAVNKGCAWELTYLVQRVPLRRIVLLVDRRTDMEAVEGVARAAWKDLTPEAESDDSRPELRVLTFARRSEADSRMLFELLLSAAGDVSPLSSTRGERAMGYCAGT